MEISLPKVQEEYERLGLTDKDIQDHNLTADYAQEKIYTKFQEAIDKDHYKRRWLYELLQNAVDCSDTEVEVKVTLSTTNEAQYLEFEHNGGYFKPPKEWNKEHDFKNFILAKTGKTPSDESTGKFGTGFLATHCLAHKIDIEGICQDDEGHSVLKKVSLDREEFYNEDDESIQIRTLKIIKALKDNETILSEDISSKPSARFHYHLTPSGLTNAREGLKELDLSIQYVFACNEKLKKILIENEGNVSIYENLGTSPLGRLHLHSTETGTSTRYTLISPMSFTENDQNYDLMLLKSLVKSDSEYQFDDTNAQYQTLFSKPMPSIYCSYPLIGSEDFQFPMIIHSRNFKPNQERNGIINHVGVGLNIALISKGVELFGSFLKEAINLRIGNIHLLLKTSHKYDYGENSWIDKDWYKGVSGLLRKIILSTKLFKTHNSPNDRISIINDSGEIQVHFIDKELEEKLELLPSESDSKQTRLDDFVKTFSVLYPSFPLGIEIRDWQSILWNDQQIIQVNLKDIIENIALKENLKKFANQINSPEESDQEENEKLAISIINNVCRFVDNYDADNKTSYFSYLKGGKSYGFVPSRSGIFRLLNDLRKEVGLFDDEINETLLIIHKKFFPDRNDYRQSLIHQGIDLKNQLTVPIEEEKIIQEMLRGVEDLIKEHYDILREIEIGNMTRQNRKNDIESILGEFWEWATEVDIEEKYIKEGPRRKILQTIIDPKKSKYLTANLALDRTGKLSLERQNQILTDEDLENKLLEGKKVLDAIKENDETFEKLKAIGKHFEGLMKEMLIDAFGVTNVQHVDGNQDFIIGDTHIELKTTSTGDHVKMHPKQAKTAQKIKDKFYLCVFEYHKPYEQVTKEEFKSGVKFTNQIGEKLDNIVINMNSFEGGDENIQVWFPEVYQSFEGMTPYKYVVKKAAWGEETYEEVEHKILDAIGSGDNAHNVTSSKSNWNG